MPKNGSAGADATGIPLPQLCKHANSRTNSVGTSWGPEN